MNAPPEEPKQAATESPPPFNPWTDPRLLYRIIRGIKKMPGWMQPLAYRTFRGTLILLVRIWAGPVRRVRDFTKACIVAFGPEPKLPNDVKEQITARFLPVLAAVVEEKRQEARTEVTDRERALIQSMTWGMAGLAVVILTGVITATLAVQGTPSTSLIVAAGCFALVIPLLVAFGMAFSRQWEDGRGRPAKEEANSLAVLISGAQLVFCVGLAALLWSFNRYIAVVFVIGCGLAWRGLKRFGLFRLQRLGNQLWQSEIGTSDDSHEL